MKTKDYTLKANAKEKRMYRLAQQIIKEGSELEDNFYRSYGYRRASGLMIDVKQYEYLDTDDLEELLKSSNIPKKYHQIIKDEFGYERISNCRHHVIENQREHLCEWLDGYATIPTVIAALYSHAPG